MALNVFGRLMPPEASFTKLFCEQAACILEAVHLAGHVAKGDDNECRAQDVEQEGRQCDRERKGAQRTLAEWGDGERGANLDPRCSRCVRSPGQGARFPLVRRKQTLAIRA